MKNEYKYFPVNAAQREWGLYVTCVGHSTTEPHAVFPSPEHPDEYFFSWERGRILHEWQLILIEDGGGVVEFKHRRHSARKGSLIVLPPGCWHRYRPNAKTGWTTLWIGFNGDLASRLIGGAGFNPEGEVRNLSNDHAFHRLMLGTIADILENGRDNVYSAAARIPMLVAALVENAPPGRSQANTSDLVIRAQMHIREHAAETVDFKALAKSLGITYRAFRYLFTKETTLSPLQYQLEVRLARAKNLLKSSDMPIADIAKTLGFNSTWYFSHFMRNRLKTSPATYRNSAK